MNLRATLTASLVITGYCSLINRWHQSSLVKRNGGYAVFTIGNKIQKEFYCQNPSFPEVFRIQIQRRRFDNMPWEFGGLFTRVRKYSHRYRSQPKRRIDKLVIPSVACRCFSRPVSAATTV